MPNSIKLNNKRITCYNFMNERSRNTYNQEWIGRENIGRQPKYWARVGQSAKSLSGNLNITSTGTYAYADWLESWRGRTLGTSRRRLYQLRSRYILYNICERQKASIYTKSIYLYKVNLSLSVYKVWYACIMNVLYKVRWYAYKTTYIICVCLWNKSKINVFMVARTAQVKQY